MLNNRKIGTTANKDELLACLGDTDGLLESIRSLAKGEPVHDDPLGNYTDSILMSAANHGDERFVEALNNLFDRNGGNELRRTACSAAIVKISARLRSPTMPLK